MMTAKRIAGWFGVALFFFIASLTLVMSSAMAEEVCDVTSCDCLDSCSSDFFSSSCCLDTGSLDRGYQKWLEAKPWQLPQPTVAQYLGIKVGGWVEAGITANGDHPADLYNGPVAANDVCGKLQMNQFWLYADRPIDTGGSGFDAGGHVEVVYGTDWRLAYAHGMGLQENLNGPNSFYGLCIPQLYSQFGFNDLSVKIGYMRTDFGYEQVPPFLNFFYSHSYLLAYSEPILITGLMAEHPLGEHVSVHAGFHQGVQQFENYNNCLNFEGGIHLHSHDEKRELSYCIDVGRNDPAGLEEEYIHAIVYEWDFAPKWKYVFQNNLGVENNVEVIHHKTAHWWGIAQYMFYQLSDTWRAGMRAEAFHDEYGLRVLGLGNLPDAAGWEGKPGWAGTFTELTFGLNWIPKPTFRIRPEIRWDWYSGTRNIQDVYPFGDGRRTSQFTFATDVVWMF